jgi:hypothetical protein
VIWRTRRKRPLGPNKVTVALMCVFTHSHSRVDERFYTYMIAPKKKKA